MAARYIMIGGFLGAGKTTAVLRLAEDLTARGRRVGLITNDQSTGLVDTAMLASHGFAVEEITGGCFCCRFNSLVDASTRLSAVTAPDAFIAEPVGSCTDLKATVSYPLRRLYGDDYSIAPLSVLVDPVRALRVLGLEPGRNFSRKVLYVYEKQLEEAEILVINKIDALDRDRLGALRAALADRYPRASPIEVSARTGAGLDAWFARLRDTDLGTAPAMDVDYDLYAEGEALLGWLNTTLAVEGHEVDGNRLLSDLATRIRAALDAAGVDIAHLKMTLSPDDDPGDIAVLNMTHNAAAPDQSHRLRAPIDRAELIVNLRAEGDPARLADDVRAAIRDLPRDAATRIDVRHLESFRPGRPSPTHRMAQAVER